MTATTEGPPARAADTSAERPWPLRVLALNIGRYLDKLPTAWIEAQIVEAKRRPGLRTVYATLRDPDTDMSMSAVIDAGLLDRLGAHGGPGARVVVLVTPQFDPRRGRLTLSVRQLRAVGVGELLARVEALKAVLHGEGLFDAGRKKPLPFLPSMVGVVCGRASAAERDVVDNARARWPAVRFRIREVPVQGEAAAAEVSEALRILDADPEVDVIVVTRGGGSLEDLLPFSSEALLRVVAACATPVVSAIGHEVDSPLLDLVADVRASTPTDAARCVVPDVAVERAGLRHARERARRCLTARLDAERRVVTQLTSRPALADPRHWLRGLRDDAGEAQRRSAESLRRLVTAQAQALSHQHAHLRSLSPQATLDRGYAMVRLPDGRVVRDPAQAPAGTPLELAVASGSFAARSEGHSG